MPAEHIRVPQGMDACAPHIFTQDMQRELDLSRFRAAPSSRLSHFPFESDGAFPAQC
jgi:hypothetical protein